MNREPIYAALWTKLSVGYPWKTASRRLLHWNDVSLQKQPALFMAQAGESARREKGQPTIWTFKVDLYVYVSTAGGLAPGPILNPVLDFITNALEPGPVEEKQTLGGLCDFCRIEGDIETYEGTLGDQEVAMVPVLIQVT